MMAMPTKYHPHQIGHLLLKIISLGHTSTFRNNLMYFNVQFMHNLFYTGIGFNR